MHKLKMTIKDTKQIVTERYSKASAQKEENLCCPKGYTGDETSHIPETVIETAYGCGNPTGFNTLKGGETVLDLGSGAGIDCFIASKKVGKDGKVIGIDMTDDMLEKANKNKKLVAESLGYDNTEFKKGHLENIPLEDNSVNFVMSNCVINLSTDKEKVFNEIFRVMKDNGTFSISDIVSDKEVPQHLKDDEELWSGCISGSLTEKEYLALMEKTGFYGLTVFKQSVWKEIEGIKFKSIVVKGHKLKRSKECVFIGQTATYTGPMKKAEDDENHTFLRGIPQEVCTETAKRLSKEPYKKSFIITDPTKKMEEGISCDPKDGCC